MNQAAPSAAGKRLEAMFSKLGELSMGHAVGARVTVEDDSALQQQQQQPLRERERQFSIAESLTDALLDEPSMPGITRAGMLSASNSPVGRWLRGGGLSIGSGAAKRTRDAARLKALQRTPYPMVLARIKLLLDRLQYFKGPMGTGSSFRRSRRLDSMASRISPSRVQSVMVRNVSSVAPAVSMGVTPSRERALSPGPESVAEVDDGDLVDLEEGTCRLPLEKIMEELNTTYAYVSDFLRKVPEHTRIQSILWSYMENYKKDQDVYVTGDEPDKFYIILTGQVEVWTYPPGQHHHHHSHANRERTVIATLKKGQSFGDQAILNDDLRSECVTPTSNCCFLTLERHAFLDIFGPYFTEKLQQAEQFFCSHVNMFRKVSQEEAMRVIRHMLLSTFKAGREWDPYSDQQIYFIKEGSCTLDAYDRKFVVEDTALRVGMGDAPAMADSGPLAHVLIQGGRAVGTLGHEEEMRRMRRQLIPKKLMAKLGVGGLFGGGPAAMGEGEMQASLKVIADTDVELYHMHVDLFTKHASPDLMKALRDDVSFKLTYYFGRNGTINDNTVVGHLDALLQVTVRTDDANPALTAALSSSVTNPNSTRGRAAAATRPVPATTRKKRSTKAHEPGQYSPEVERALKHVQELQEGYANDPTLARHLELVKSGVTPVQRFWSTPAVSNTARGNAITGLLAQVFPEGLAPLGCKIDELIERAARRTEAELAATASAAGGGGGGRGVGTGGAPCAAGGGGGRPYTADAAAAAGGDAAGLRVRVGAAGAGSWATGAGAAGAGAGAGDAPVSSPSYQSSAASPDGVSPVAQRMERLLAVRNSSCAPSPMSPGRPPGGLGDGRIGSPAAKIGGHDGWIGSPAARVGGHDGWIGSPAARVGGHDAPFGSPSGAGPGSMELPGMPDGPPRDGGGGGGAAAWGAGGKLASLRPASLSVGAIAAAESSGGGGAGGSPGPASAGASGGGGVGSVGSVGTGAFLTQRGSPSASGLYARRSTRTTSASLTAAGIMWERLQETATPGMRQCLTYEEIVNVRRVSLVESPGGGGGGAGGGGGGGGATPGGSVYGGKSFGKSVSPLPLSPSVKGL